MPRWVDVTRMRLGELLVHANRITFEELNRALAVQRASSRSMRIGETLVELGLCSESSIAHAIAEQLGIPYLDTAQVRGAKEAVEAMGLQFCHQQEVLPIAVEGGGYLLAMSDPLGVELVDVATRVLNQPVHAAAAPRSSILDEFIRMGGPAQHVRAVTHEALGKPVHPIPPAAAESAPEGKPKAGEPEQKTDRASLERQASDALTVRLVGEILGRGIEEHASDIHIEPTAEGVAIRFRVRGALREALRVPKGYLGPALARIKLLAEMDIGEQHLPQQGHILFPQGGTTVGLHVATIPTNLGEKCVIRVSGSPARITSLDDTGLPAGQLAAIREAIRQPRGCIILAGPAGSGRTTMAYACLSDIRGGAVNIATVEARVECDLEGIAQVDLSSGESTAAEELRSIVNGELDVVFVGDAKDAETVQVALEAAQGQHCMLLTLHATDAIGAITRLRDLGLEDALTASATTLLVGQRLLRRLCPSCRRQYSPDQLETTVLADVLDKPYDGSLYESQGCKECGDRGHVGPLAVAEVLPVTARFASLIRAGARESDLRSAAEFAGGLGMFRSGLDRVLAGDTTLRELMGVVPLPVKETRPAAPQESIGGVRLSRPNLPGTPALGPIPGQRVFGTGPRMDPAEFEAFCRGQVDLPTLPAAHARIIQVLSNPEADIREITESVETDPVIAARVVRVANSALYGPKRRIASVHDSVVYLGMAQVWSICMATSVMAAVSGDEVSPVPFEGLWTHSLAAAVCSRELARASGRGDPGQAALTALLHDMGKLIMGLGRPQDISQCIRSAATAGVPLWQVEQEFLSFTHAQAGGWLLQSWRMPEPVATAVAYHHDPDKLPEGSSGEAVWLARLVRFANDAVKAAGIGESGDHTVLQWKTADLTELGLTPVQVGRAVNATIRAVPAILEAVRKE